MSSCICQKHTVYDIFKAYIQNHPHIQANNRKALVFDLQVNFHFTQQTIYFVHVQYWCLHLECNNHVAIAKTIFVWVVHILMGYTCEWRRVSAKTALKMN